MAAGTVRLQLGVLDSRVGCTFAIRKQNLLRTVCAASPSPRQRSHALPGCDGSLCVTALQGCTYGNITGQDDSALWDCLCPPLPELPDDPDSEREARCLELRVVENVDNAAHHGVLFIKSVWAFGTSMGTFENADLANSIGLLVPQNTATVTAVLANVTVHDRHRCLYSLAEALAALDALLAQDVPSADLLAYMTSLCMSAGDWQFYKCRA